ncbi:MAG: glycosyltransferase family 2 protein [Verrucomicrobia bacterium]|nr:glycosyltransferase family 2 protein [Verrucomicrobiota bacterium]MDE3098606.1 glycosyltransferase family 2 protein [Verrucomicrobiota bacterium]
MERLPISVCMIAGNEARRIRRALESVAGWTSEIVVVIDDKVTDGTGKIAESYGAKVFSQPWNGHSAHRNFAAEQATQSWLLGLDADEEVSHKLRGEIISAVARLETDSPDAYSFPRCTLFCGRWIRHGDWYPDRKVRLWRRGRAKWSGALHEKLVVEGRVEKLRGDLLHYSMDSLDHFTRKSIMVSGLFVRQKLEQGAPPGALEMWLRPWWRFVRGFVFRLGFLDGWQGYAIARMVAFETFLRYAKLREARLAPENGKFP